MGRQRAEEEENVKEGMADRFKAIKGWTEKMGKEHNATDNLKKTKTIKEQTSYH